VFVTDKLIYLQMQKCMHIKPVETAPTLGMNALTSFYPKTKFYAQKRCPLLIVESVGCRIFWLDST
jgi:hypothetical protein